AAGFEVLPGLLEAFTQASVDLSQNDKASIKNQSLLRLMPPEAILDIKQNKGNSYSVLMSCIDFVSGMTDRHAISLFRKIKGISLPNS
ncbi:MAG: dGTPase, partial [Fulvivirga sp.]